MNKIIDAKPSRSINPIGIALLLCLLCALCLGASACSYVKLTTVRPAEISLMTVERLSDGKTASLPNETQGADQKDVLIFQLEEPYDRVGKCGDSDGHVYRVSLYIGDKLDTEVLINADGSVCRRSVRYASSDRAEEPVDIMDWDSLFPKGE